MQDNFHSAWHDRGIMGKDAFQSLMCEKGNLTVLWYLTTFQYTLVMHPIEIILLWKPVSVGLFLGKAVNSKHYNTNNSSSNFRPTKTRWKLHCRLLLDFYTWDRLIWILSLTVGQWMINALLADILSPVYCKQTYLLSHISGNSR